MTTTPQEERNRQLTLGIAFSAAALAVLVALIFKLGYCCEWFGVHPHLG